MISVRCALFFCLADCYYLSPDGIDAESNGGSASPLRTLRFAIEEMLKDGTDRNYTLFLRPGLYYVINNPLSEVQGLNAPTVADSESIQWPFLHLIPDPGIIPSTFDDPLPRNQQITISTNFTGSFLSTDSSRMGIVVEDIVFCNNSDGQIPGLYPALTIQGASLVVRRCVFHGLKTPSTDNRLEAGWFSGPAISGPSASRSTLVVVENSVFEECVSGQDGGAIYLELAGELRLSNVLFRGVH